MVSNQLVETLADRICEKRPNIKKESAKRTAYRKIKKEVKAGRIRRFTNPDRSRVYGLPNWPYNELKIKVEAYFKDRKEWQWSQTTLNDVANELGVPPNEIEKLAYQYGKHYGVKIGTEIVRDVSYPKGAWRFG